MKKILLLAGLALALCTSLTSQAQVRFSIQIGAPVMRQSWADYDDDYYYMPEQDVYYNVRRNMYVYPEGGTWVYAPALPARYNGCTYGSTRYYRVHDRAPFNRGDYYRSQYRVAYNNGGNYYRHDNGMHRGWDRDNRRDNDRGRDNRDYRGQNNHGNSQGNGNWQGNGNSNHFNRR